MTKKKESKNLHEKYRFFLNPYPDKAFTNCPECGEKTRQKKLPLTIHMEKKKLFVNLNKTCRFCEPCELLIVKKQEIEALLSRAFGEKMTDKDYCIVGTLDKDCFKEGMSSPEDLDFINHFYVFKDVWKFEIMPRYVGEDEMMEKPFGADKARPKLAITNTITNTITKGEGKKKDILEPITNNPTLSAEKIARHVGLTQVGVRYHINNLKKKGIIRRKGHVRGGSWGVLE